MPWSTRQVGAVVHRDVRLVVDCGLHVPVVRVVVFALDGENGDAEVLTSAAATSSCVESGFDAQSDDSAPPAFSVRARFAVSVVTCRQAEMRIPGERLLLREALADRRRPACPVGPLDPADAPSARARSFTSWPSCGGHQLSSRWDRNLTRRAAARACAAPSRALSTPLPCSHVFDRGAQIGLSLQAGGEDDVGELDGKAPTELSQRPELIQLPQRRTNGSRTSSGRQRRGPVASR